MAITLRKETKIDLGGLIENALSTVKDVRRSEQARKEAEFQKAIADGTLSYDAQIKFRNDQLEKEKASPISDATYVTQLEASVGDLKRLSRYSKMREKYKSSLDEYISGKGNIQSVIDILQDSLRGEADEALKSELRGQLTTALRDKATLERSAIQNRITIAEKDKSVELIDRSINDVQSKKSEALLADDPDTASMWDATLASLKSTRSTIKIENGMADINYRINKDNLTSGEKLGLLNKQVNDAEDDAPVVFNGIRYDSLKSFWLDKRGGYIKDNYLEEVKNEIENETNRIATLSPFGQVPVERIKAVANFYDDLSKRDEFRPYALQIEQQKVSTVTSLATELTKALGDEASILIDRGQDATSVVNKTYGIYARLENEVGVKLARPQTNEELKAGKTLGAEVSKTVPNANQTGNFPVITDPSAPKPTPAAAPVVPPVAPAPAVVPAAEVKPLTSPAPAASPTYAIQKGDTLSALALKNKTSVAEIQKLNKIDNPNIIKVGQVIRFK